MHYIVYNPDEGYMYHRRNTGDMYVNRTVYGLDIDSARVFTTKNAAKNASVYKNQDQILAVELNIKGSE
jgi:hypothetical protein